MPNVQIFSYIMKRTRKNCFRYLKLMSPLNEVKGQCPTKVITVCHIPNIIDLSGKTKKLWSGQASQGRSRRSRRKNQTKTLCLPSFEGLYGKKMYSAIFALSYHMLNFDFSELINIGTKMNLETFKWISIKWRIICIFVKTPNLTEKLRIYVI